jgi:hypothetical protein
MTKSKASAIPVGLQSGLVIPVEVNPKSVFKRVSQKLAQKAPKLGKPKGTVTLVGDLEKSKRPLMVSDMDYKQVFIREGKLCMRVMNVCNANIKGKASKRTDLWIVDLQAGKTFLSSDIPVELVDVQITITNKAEKKV